MKIIVLFILTLLVVDVNAVCCAPFNPGCCNTGICDVFCCNCTGDCIPDCPAFSLKKPGISSAAKALDAKKKFNSIDFNKDGMIQLEEATAYLNLTLPVGSTDRYPKWFTDIDKNNDGVITPHELDPLL